MSIREILSYWTLCVSTEERESDLVVSRTLGVLLEWELPLLRSTRVDPSAETHVLTIILLRFRHMLPS